MVLGYERGGAHDSLDDLFFHFFFGLPFVLYFLPSIIALARSKRDTARDLSAQSFSGMERHWMDRRAGLGGQERRSRDGEVTSAP